MYYRESNSGHKVVWDPIHEDIAEKAMGDLKGEGVPDHVTLPDDANVPLEGDVAEDVRHRYTTLVLDRDIRDALDAGKEDLAESLKEDYKDHTGEEWKE